MFLVESGDVYTCGWNNFGQLGQDAESLSDPSTRGVPTLVTILRHQGVKGEEVEDEDEDEDEDENVVSIAAGARHTVCLSSKFFCLLFYFACLHPPFFLF